MQAGAQAHHRSVCHVKCLTNSPVFERLCKDKMREKRENRKAFGKSNRNLFRNLSNGDRRKCAMPCLCVCASLRLYRAFFAFRFVSPMVFFRFSNAASASSFRISSEFGFGPGTSIIRERKVSCSGRFYILRRLSLASFCFSCSLFVFFYLSSSPATLSSLCRCGGGSVDTGMDKDSREREQMPLDS